MNSGDGNCIVWDITEGTIMDNEVTKLTGPNSDPISSIKRSGGNICTSCRDGCVRVYSIADISCRDNS